MSIHFFKWLDEIKVMFLKAGWHEGAMVCSWHWVTHYNDGLTPQEAFERRRK
jgi:hypothetical protein